ncbi:threonine aldolase family protein [Phaeacidiphilus oryzae]|uniref:threonine aldolase family protein n=1 Tax=Phaeacidiphilus oryzae TaxID=348818 RepID=UPI00068C0A31|nr:beta-eliminating lyase-related protein [Phaeacidiphilus oryzae]
MDDQDLQERLATAWRGCDRIFSGVRPRTLRDRIAELAGPEVEAAYDLGEPTDMYGNGVVAALEKRVAGLLGTEAAAFFPTGTMAQQVALRCWSERTGNPIVAMHPLAHPEVHERLAYSWLSGLRSVRTNAEPRQPTADEIRGIAEPFGTLMLELPLRDAGFLLPEWDELVEVVGAARERDAVVHFDGARLWESVDRLGHELPEIAALADSVYVSFYKTLGGISGAALAGSEELIGQAKTWRHRYGGQLFEQWPAALAALAGIERELPRLGSYVARARVAAEVFGEVLAAEGLPFGGVWPSVPHTHQFRLWLPFAAERLQAAALRLVEKTGVGFVRGWRDGGLPGVSAFAEVTLAAPGAEWSREEIAETFQSFLAQAREG